MTPTPARIALATECAGTEPATEAREGVSSNLGGGGCVLNELAVGVVLFGESAMTARTIQQEN